MVIVTIRLIINNIIILGGRACRGSFFKINLNMMRIKKSIITKALDKIKADIIINKCKRLST